MTDTPLTCETLDALLPDYLEGEMDAATRATVESHARSCARCEALLGDLTAIARDARALPDLAPSRDLWAGIEGRIQAPVVSFPAPGAARPHARWRATAWLGAAAAALIVATASITYTITMRHAQQQSQLAATRPSVTTPVTNVAALPVERVYDQEITRLQQVLQERRSTLDSNTVAVIERNLRIIDAAIAQSREALEKDPASGLLNDQLNSALTQKVELLRTAALLPART
jgi:anti-sigma factor RsiW